MSDWTLLDFVVLVLIQENLPQIIELSKKKMN